MKRTELFDRYLKWYKCWFNIYERKTDELIDRAAKLADIPLKANYSFFKAAIWLAKKTYKVARYSTIPFHLFWYFAEKRALRKKQSEHIPALEMGGHYIYGKPGEGKSTFVYYLMEYNGMKTGKAAYTTEQMETPRTNEKGDLYYHHQRIDIHDIYSNGEQMLGFDGDKFNMLVYEELLATSNHRNNNKKSYNDVVIPLVGSMGTGRHQGLLYFYFISQLFVNDTQIMQMLKYHHQPKAKFKYGYLNWLKTGRIQKQIIGWRVKLRQLNIWGNNNYTIDSLGSYYVKNEMPDEMKYFNRLNMKSKYDRLPKIKTMGVLE